jgi:hypothetical protein
MLPTLRQKQRRAARRRAAFENSFEVKGIMGNGRLDYKGRGQNRGDKVGRRVHETEFMMIRSCRKAEFMGVSPAT